MIDLTIKAVLFDLYDTLVYSNTKKFQDKVRQCACICHVTETDYQRAWQSLVVDSNLGKYPRTEARVKTVMQILGVPIQQENIDLVTKLEHRFLESGILLFDDTIPTLSALQEKGIRLGLVTNASPSVHLVLSNLNIKRHFQSIIISSEVGYRKPDLEIYRIALDKLGINTKDTVFIGDGNDRELEGAYTLGITTIMIKRNISKYIQIEDSSMDSVNFTIESLGDVLNIIT